MSDSPQAETPVRDGVPVPRIANPTPPETPPAATDDAQPERREAVIYLPGLMRVQDAETLEDVAHRIAMALDNTDEDRKAVYSVEPNPVLPYEGAPGRSARIVRTDQDGTPAVMDVYEFDYLPVLTDGAARARPIVQLGQILGVLLLRVHVLLRLLRPGQTRGQKLQAAVGMTYAGILVAALFTTGVAAADLATERLAETRAPATQTADAPAPLRRSDEKGAAAPATDTAAARLAAAVPDSTAPVAAASDSVAAAPPAARSRGLVARTLAGWWAWLGTAWLWVQIAVLGAPLLGLLSRASLKATLARVSAELVCASRYLDYGERRTRIMGQLSRLLDHMGSRTDVRYDRIHLVGYSFGSVVAMDAVFQDTEVNETFRGVSSLVTIGCPFDFIRTYWTDYYRDRVVRTPAVTWLNVYAPRDVLSSNFTDGPVDLSNPEASLADSASGVVRRGVSLRGGGALGPDEHIRFGPSAPASLLGWLVFALKADGFRAHSGYWEHGRGDDMTCFEPVMRRLRAREAAAG